MRYFTLLTVLVLFQVLYSCGQSQKQNTKNNASPGKDSSIAVFSGTQPSINMNDGKDTGKAFQLFQQGVNEMKEQRYEDAVSTFLSALELDPQNPKIFYNLGSCYYTLKEYSLALSYFSDAIKFNPSDTSSMIYSGMIHYTQGRIQESIALYTKAIKISDQLYMAFYNRGTSYGRLELYDMAISDFSAAIKINPSHANSYMNRGLAYYYSGKAELACKDWEVAAKKGVPMASEAIREHCR